ISENLRAFLSYGYTASRLTERYERDYQTGKDVLITDPDLFPIHTAEGDASTITATIDYDTRNDRFRPSKGIHAKASVGTSGLIGGNLHYYRTTADFRFFRNLFWDVVWRNNLSWAQIGST